LKWEIPKTYSETEDTKEYYGNVYYIEVRGAGHKALNGIYFQKGIRNGVCKFVLEKNNHVYEVSRAPSHDRKQWWISRTDVSPDIYYYTSRWTGILPPKNEWRRCGNGTDPVPQVLISKSITNQNSCFSPGRYRFTVKTWLQAEFGQSSYGQRDVQVGDVIDVHEVFFVPEENRFRGRVHGGYLTIYNREEKKPRAQYLGPLRVNGSGVW